MKIHLLMAEWVDDLGHVGSSIIHEAYLERDAAVVECMRKNEITEKSKAGKYVYYVADVPLKGKR